MRSVNEFNFAVLKYNYNINSDLHGGHFGGMAQKKDILLIPAVSRGYRDYCIGWGSILHKFFDLPIICIL